MIVDKDRSSEKRRTTLPAAADWNELRYRLLFETVDEGVVYCDNRGVLISANPKAIKTFGVTHENAIGRNWAELDLDAIDESGAPIPLEQRPVMLAIRTGHELRNFVMGVLNKRERKRRWIRIQAVPLFREGEDSPCEAYSIFTDITEEKAKRERLELLREISDASSDLIFAKDRSGRITFANPAYLEVLGRGESEVLGRTDADLLDAPRDARAIMEHDLRVMESGQPAAVEEVRASRDGEPRYFMSKKAPYRDDEGNVIGLLGISREITERRRAAEERAKLLQTLESTGVESERNRKQLEAVFQAMSDGMIVFDMSRKVVLVNKAARSNLEGSKVVGDEEHDIVSLLHKTELFLPEGERLPPEQTPLSRVLRGESLSQWELLGRRKDTGQQWYFSFSGEPVRDSDGKQILALIIRRDITRAKQIENALRDADRRKDAFMSMLSHELRNPLAPMRNAAYMLNHCAPGSDDADRARQIIERQVGHLTRLVDDLLDVTRIARGKAVLKLETLDLRQVVHQLAEDHRELIRSSGLRLDLTLPNEPVWIMGDATRLAQVIGNLLNNAVKFTPSPGRIEIGLASRDGKVTVRVRDTGHGIEPAVLASVFDPFTQGPQDLARPGGGLGLGLALVKGFTELHGGTVHAASEGRGKGAEFVLTFPLAKSSSTAKGDVARRPSKSGKQVLVVDDNHDSAETLASIVRMFGHEAQIAYDGPETVRLARERHPDVILCDIGLPSMDGYEVARAIRSDPTLADIRLVALSGYAQAEDRRKSRDAGFDEHIAKPADPELIIKAIG